MIMINWPSKYLVLARCVVFIRFDYTLIAEDSLWFLFWSQKKRVRERKEKKKKRKQKMLEWYIFLVQAVDLKPQKAEEVACVAGQERTGAREGDTRGEREGLPGRPTKIVQLAFYECGYFQLVERFPREKLTALGERNDMKLGPFN